jgi:predicted RNase H-like nuclease (RuvC/YqgF family)
MTNRLTAYSVKATALALALGLSAQAMANMYRFTDENGQIVISSTIPQEATKRGYDILSNNGRVIETIPPAPTEEEIAAREAEEQRQKELAEQREKDRELLKRFSHPDQAVKAMHRKIQELEGLIQLKRGNISVISSQLDNEQSRAADMERAGREIPEATLEKIRRLGAQIRDLEQEIAAQSREIQELRKAFEADIERLEEVTGEERSLPLDSTETEN